MSAEPVGRFESYLLAGGMLLSMKYGHAADHVKWPAAVPLST
jgi:hypothetical protein